MTQKISRAIRLAFLAVLGFSSGTYAADRPYTIGTLQNPIDVFPLKQYSGQNNIVRNLLFPPILYVQNDGRVRCVLCKELPSVETRKGESGVYVVTLELKKDLKWGDGTAITAEDVKFTLENMAKTVYPAGEHPILPIRRIEFDKEQKRKITLVLRHRRSDAFQLFAISLLPAKRAKDLEGVVTQPAKAYELFQDPGFSYGPYRISKLNPQTWELVSNEKTEWDQKPDQPIDLKFYPKLENLREALKTSSIDQTEELSWTNFESLKAQWAELDSKYDATGVPSDDLQVFLLNLHSPVLVNPQLRQAFYYSVNRAELNALKYQNMAEIGSGILSENFAKRLEMKRPEAYNPKLATQILDQSGWVKNAEGIRSSEGQHFIVSLVCPAGRLNEKWLASLKSELSGHGIKLEVEHPEAADFMKKVVSERRFKDLACASWTLPPLSIPNNIFHSLAIPNRENNYFGANYSAWDQHVVDKLLDNMLRETELHHFTRQFARLEKQFLSDLPAIPLVYEPKVTLKLKAPLNQPSEELSRVLQPATAPKKL